jgi:hypothetical protein
MLRVRGPKKVRYAGVSEKKRSRRHKTKEKIVTPLT